MSANIMKLTLKTVLGACLALAISACSAAPSFVSTRGGQFIKNGNPYTYIGTNFWYGPILASEGQGGDYVRLTRELDTLKALGVTNLRVLVGADGPSGVFSRVEPTLQTAPGVYNDTLLTGLDRFLVELGKRDMQAVLFLNNSWEWSGGYGQYLEWGTGEKALIPLVDGYWPFMQQMRKFQTSTEAQQLFFNHVRAIVGRTNNEGWMGSEQDWDLVRRINTIPGVDYMTIHIWPYNWSWASAEDLEGTLDAAIGKTAEYLAQHATLAQELGLPLVCEEFGFPRDGFSPAMSATTRVRDSYYKYLFGQVGETLQGANFWGWSGFAVPLHEQWESGDPYTGDPAQEAQGLNGVYVTDTTVDILKNAIQNLNQ